MAYPTKAQWDAAIESLTVYPSLGQALMGQAPIILALGVPAETPLAGLRVNWTDGATAASLGTTAGIPNSGAAATVDDSFSLGLAQIASQAYRSKATEADVQAGNSQSAAVAQIYRTWVSQLIGSGDGTAFDVWGIQDFVVNSPNQVDLVGGEAADILETIDDVMTNLPQSGYNVCITSPEGYNLVKRTLRTAAGGNTAGILAMQDFGFPTLQNDGCLFFRADQISVDASNRTPFNFFNMGPEGCQLVGASDGIFLADGPKQTAGTLSEVWDVVLRLQMLYGSKRAAYRLLTSVS